MLSSKSWVVERSWKTAATSIRRGHIASSRQAASLHTLSTTAEETKLKQVIIVTGPTAVGKTAVGLELARLLDGEIISADSVQVYRGLDIGSDKLPFSQRQGIPHHLIDVIDTHEEFSAGHFYEAARAATVDITQRARVPIVVGGTGLYLRWYVLGKASTPRPTKESEEAAEKMVQEAVARATSAAGVDELSPEARWDAAVDLLAELGDVAAATRIRAERNNYFRLIRALQVLITAEPGKTLADMDIDEQRPPDYDFRCFFLCRSRLVIKERISSRVEEMVLGGLLDEAAGLLAAGLKPGTTMATRAIGYRQAMEWLEELVQQQRLATQKDVCALVELVRIASHKLVRAQMTWFRDEAAYRWLDMDTLSVEDAAKLIVMECAKPSHEGGSSANSGRLSKEEERLMRRYNAPLVRLNDAAVLEPVLDHINTQILPSLQGRSANGVLPVMESLAV